MNISTIIVSKFFTNVLVVFQSVIINIFFNQIIINWRVYKNNRDINVMNNKFSIKLSVIVPIYNSEKYLKQCIDSIVNQIYDNIEIILVDDGSTDFSGKICDMYQNINKRIQVIHQKNQGCISARWNGVQKSKGDYIGFVDSDDWIALDMYKNLMSIVKENECDIVSMGYTAVCAEGKIEVDDATLFGLYRKGKNLDILLSNMMYDANDGRRGIHPSLCSKVIKRKLIMNEFAKVDKNISIGEDAAIFYPCCLEAKSIFVMKEYKYHYRIRYDSMCRSINLNTFSEVYCFYQYMQTKFKNYERKYNLLKQLKRYVWNFLALNLKQIFDIWIGIAYLFPYNKIDKNSNIILYGAGEVGQAFYAQLFDNHYCNIIAWVDKNKSNRRNIIYPNQILKLNYDKIVIAIRNETIANEIINELIMLGISKEKIFWSQPQQIESTIL